MSDHLSALQLRLSNERLRLARATQDSERTLRETWIRQIEKEIAAEQIFIGETSQLTDEELLKELRG